MAVTIVDRRTTVDQADTTTGWTGAGFGTITTDIAEAGSAVAEALNTAAGSIYFTLGTAVDMSDTLIYVYSFNNAIQFAWDNTIPPNGLLIGDGTNRIAFHQAGSNRRVFSHSDGPVNWQSLLLDGSQASTQNTAGLTFADSGNFASLTLTSITQFGAYFETDSKALGGGYNVAVDIIRYGNDGIYVVGGTTGDRGTFLQLAAADRSTADGAAHGIFRELSPSSFGVQGPLTFGRVDVATTSYFEDSNKSVAYEDRFVSDGKYYFDVAGNASATNVFRLSNSTITTAGPNLRMSCTSNIDELVITGVSFVNWGNTISFPTDTVTNTLTHQITDCSFAGAAEISPNSVEFQRNTISGYTGTSGAVLISSTSVTSNWSNLTFTSVGTGHAIEITSTGTYSITNFTFNGYASTDGTTGNEAVYNNSGGAVTLNVSGGSGITVRNGTGASTTVNNNVDITVTGLEPDTEVRVYARDTTTELAGIETATTVDTNDSTKRQFTFSLGAGTEVDVVVISLEFENQRIAYTIPTTNSTLPVQQRIDRNYLNPNGIDVL